MTVQVITLNTGQKHRVSPHVHVSIQDIPYGTYWSLANQCHNLLE